MTMPVFYLIVGLVLLGGSAARHWYRTAVAQRDARDAAALSACAFGAKFRTAELGQPHDQVKAEIAHRSATRVERRHRKVAASRVSAPKAPVPSRVTPIRKVAK